MTTNPPDEPMTPTVATDLIEVQLPDPPLSAFERERRAFHRLLPELLHTHRGQYVAVHGERVVDSGPDQLQVALRAQVRVQAGVYVGLVSEEQPPVARSGIRRVLCGQSLS